MADRARFAEEFGDLLFALVNLARHAKIDAETALRAANLKFERRFQAIERMLAAKVKTPAQSSLAAVGALWDAAKAAPPHRADRSCSTPRRCGGDRRDRARVPVGCRRRHRPAPRYPRARSRARERRYRPRSLLPAWREKRRSAWSAVPK